MTELTQTDGLKEAMGEVSQGLESTGQALLSESTGVLLVKLGIVLAIFSGGYLLIKILLKILEKVLAKSRMDPVLHTFFINCVRIVLWIVVILTGLDYLGIPLTSFLTILGAAGVAVALALKDSMANFAGGILISMTKPFSKGDLIEDMEILGKVEKIDLLYTTLATFDNKIITVPNGKLANSTIVNYTRAKNRRVDCTFSIGYKADILQAKNILSTVAKSDARIFLDPAPLIGVAKHGDNAIDLDFKVWCKTEDYWDVLYFIQEQVKLAFDEAGIEIPYPQLDVHVKK